tara:strand:+ start:1333 stop:2787 length:1455 start_codon:yes stop_codon:yes gene_type:complete
MIDLDAAKNELKERGLIAWDLETTGLKTFANSPGGPIKIEFIRPISGAFLLETELGFETLLDYKARLAPHILPSPGALVVNGIDPSDLFNPDLPTQLDFAKAVSDLLKDYIPILCSFNGIGYDAVILRHFFFENLCYPYLLSDANRVHIDLMKIAEAIYAIDPHALNFPRKPNGNVWLSQEMLAKANGIDTGKAHTAVDDTKVVLELGKLFREIAPDVYFSAIASGNKHRVIHHLENEPIVCHAYVERFTRKGKVRALTLIGQNPVISNNYLTFDLSYDPEDYLNYSGSDIAESINKKDSPFFSLKVSDNPILLPSTYTDKIGLLGETARRRAATIDDNFKEKALQGINTKGNPFADFPVDPYSESKLYAGGFPEYSDLHETFLNSDYSTRKELLSQFTDPRILDFAKRIMAQDQTTSEPEFYNEYLEMCRSRFFATSNEVPYLTYDGAMAQIDQIIARDHDEEVVRPILQFYEDLKNKMEKKA